MCKLTWDRMLCTAIAIKCPTYGKEVVNDQVTPERDLSLSTGLRGYEAEGEEALDQAFSRTQMVSALVLFAPSRLVHKLKAGRMKRRAQSAVRLSDSLAAYRLQLQSYTRKACAHALFFPALQCFRNSGQ